jgi:hypothetical protein
MEGRIYKGGREGGPGRQGSKEAGRHGLRDAGREVGRQGGSERGREVCREAWK